MFLQRKQKQKHHLAQDGSISSPDERRQGIQDRIRDLKREIRYSKLWMILFFIVSLGAAIDFRFSPPLSEKMRELLGASPPSALISIALIVYAFSALVLIMGRMNTDSLHFRGWSHIGYLSAFYLFYHYTGMLRENFWLVFIAGLTILGLENYRVWSSCSEAIRAEEKILAILEK